MNVLGIDPGPAESAYVVVDESMKVLMAAKVSNRDLLIEVKNFGALYAGAVAIECLQSYGPVTLSQTIWETAYWIGAFRLRAEDTSLPVHLYPRPLIARSLIGGKFSDAALRQALLTRFGGDRKGEPLNKLKGSTDLRSAFAVAVYFLDGARLGEWKAA
jgi:hypothetical protein